MSVKVEIIDESTDEIWAVIDLEDETVDIIKKLKLSIEDAITGTFKSMADDYKKDPNAFTRKYTELSKKISP